MPMIGHRLGGLRPKFHSCRHFDSVLVPLARSSRSGARTFFPIGGRCPDGSVRRCTQGASLRGSTDCAAPRLPRRRLPRGGHLLTLPLFSFSLREAGRERSLHCRWLAQCSDRGGRLLGLHSHPSRREGTRRRNHDRHSRVGGWRGGGTRWQLRGGGCHDTPRSVIPRLRRALSSLGGRVAVVGDSVPSCTLWVTGVGTCTGRGTLALATGALWLAFAVGLAAVGLAAAV